MTNAKNEYKGYLDSLIYYNNKKNLSRKLDDIVGLLKHSTHAGHNRFSGGQTLSHTLKAGAY